MTVADPPAVRQSFAGTYSKCPLSARLDELQGDHASHAQARGTCQHEFARRLVATLIDKGERIYPPDAAKDLMALVISESGLPISDTEYETLMVLAWKFAAERIIDIDNIVDLEEPYTSELDGVTITGRPDVVAIADRVATVTDYKTSFATDPDADLQGTFQLRWYAKLIFDAYPHVETVRMVVDYVRWGTVGEAEIHRWELEGLERYLRTLLAQIAKSRADDSWAPVAGSWCKQCPARRDPELCPIPLSQRGEGAIDTPETAHAYAEQLVTLDALRADRQAALRSWCSDEEAEIAVGDLVFGFKKKADGDRVRDKDLLRSAMAAEGIPWDVHFKTVKGSAEFKARKAASQ